MDTLIAEDLLLLLLDDDSGALTASTYAQPALGGALLVELAMADLVTVEKPAGMWSTAKVHPGPGATAPADPLLAQALATVAEKPRTAQDLVNRLGKGVRDTLATRLADRGVLERRDDRVLGLFPRTRWPAVDSRHEEEVRRALAATLVQGLDPDARTGALVALLHAIGQAHKVVDRQGRSAGEVRRRAKEVAEGQWAAKAVKDAVAASIAAMTAAVAAGGAVAGSS
ncbi:GOLPH3/VPS74 family protein [Nocardioides ferulae]|uniref:GOLPH3/VPS74 family protein n=1 Tax=Nocardioides ferulae TaxID=2340821 RepID=UPI000EB32DD4|nr:GPP34 family phosphoprotein [Nocardioides ferulae]